MYPNFSSKNNDHLIFVATKSLLTDAKVIYIYIYTAGLQNLWKSGRSFLGNHTCSQEINQLQVT